MAQFGRPTSDISTGAWTTTPLFSDIDEAVPDDGTTEVVSESDPSSDVFECALTNTLTDPVSSTGHIYRFTHEMTESGGGAGSTNDLTCALFQSTTQIATTTVNPTKNIWATSTLTLSGAEADSITDYTDLRLRFTANKTGGAKVSVIHVTQGEFEIPDAVSATNPVIDFMVADDAA